MAKQQETDALTTDNDNYNRIALKQYVDAIALLSLDYTYPFNYPQYPIYHYFLFSKQCICQQIIHFIVLIFFSFQWPLLCYNR